MNGIDEPPDESAWSPHPVEILVVEDSPADLHLLEIAIERHGLPARIHPTTDGATALAFLDAHPRPDLVILDLGLPGISGLELLARLKGDPALRSIPVIVLSGSDDPSAIARSYQLQASAYLRKPDSSAGYTQLVRAFADFWLSVALLPR